MLQDRCTTADASIAPYLVEACALIRAAGFEAHPFQCPRLMPGMTSPQGVQVRIPADHPRVEWIAADAHDKLAPSRLPAGFEQCLRLDHACFVVESLLDAEAALAFALCFTSPGGAGGKIHGPLQRPMSPLRV